jgi:hypothetical protein
LSGPIEVQLGVEAESLSGTQRRILADRKEAAAVRTLPDSLDLGRRTY